MIVSVWDIGIDNRFPLKKIFVLKISDEKLNIVDNSSTFEVEGRGPEVSVNTDTINIDHGCHGCNFENLDKLNKQKQKYLLRNLKYEEVLKSSKPHYNNIPIGVLKKYYNLNKQELMIEI